MDRGAQCAHDLLLAHSLLQEQRFRERIRGVLLRLAGILIPPLIDEPIPAAPARACDDRIIVVAGIEKERRASCRAGMKAEAVRAGRLPAIAMPEGAAKKEGLAEREAARPKVEGMREKA